MSGSVYAKPVTPRIVLRPILATIFLHALVVYLLTANWTNMDQKVIKPKLIPKAINAKLVTLDQLKPPPKTPQPVAKPAPKKPAPKPVEQTKPKPEAKPKPKPEPKPQPKVEPKPQPKPEPKPEPEPRISEAERAARAREELARAMAAEEQQLATATAQEMASSYAALIQRTVVGYWSRPPSARNGMEVLLAIQLIPTGDVVSVTIVRSSGNAAFDNSAINAVRKAGSFPELKNLPPREFEQTFRRFSLLFRPEDLRY